MAEKTNRSTVSPFNRPSEDVILRSLDGLELYINKWVLTDASTVFADMFDVPQPPAADHGSIQVADGALPDAKPPPSDNTPPVIPVSEDGNTLEQLLKLCYPLSVSPTFLTFDSVKPVLVAAHKYHIDHALELVRPRLQHFSRTQPVHVYAFAARYGMTTLMEDAARDFLMLPDMWAYASELDGVSGTEYHRLLMYRNRCAATLKDLIATPLRTYFPDPDAWIWLTCSSCRKHRCGDGKCVPECKEAAWFQAHWDKLGTLLHATPALDAIRDPKLTEEPMKEAVTCSTCRNKVFRHMRRFSELFFAEVELRLSKILLDDVLR